MSELDDVRLQKKETRRRHVNRLKMMLSGALRGGASSVRTVLVVLTPVFSAVSIWISVVGIAFTLFSGVEPFIAVAHWVRFLTLSWREFTHRAWDILSPYVGFQIPVDLKDFATFLFMISIALAAGFLSGGKRLVVYEAIVGIRMAIYGVAHAIGPARQASPEVDVISKMRLLFFEINEFLSKYLRSFIIYSFPSLVVVNVAFRVAIVLIPMIILVPESAFEDHIGVRASRVEYIVVSAILSYSAAIVVLVGGVAHLTLHYFRAVSEFMLFSLGLRGDIANSKICERLKKSFCLSRFGVTYQSIDPARKLWASEPFLARLSASMIRPNWVWFPISRAEAFHRKYDIFLRVSEPKFDR